MGRLSKSAMAAAAVAAGVAFSLFALSACSPGGTVVRTSAAPAPAMVTMQEAPSLGPMMVTPSCPAQMFADGVYVLQTAFDFPNNGGYNLPTQAPTYTAPAAVGGQTLGALKLGNQTYANYDQTLVDAFTIAPPYLQAALCSLESKQGVFLDPFDKALFGWSFWEVAGQGSGTGRYIALGQRLFESGADLARLENLILHALLRDPGTKYIIGPPGAKVTSAVETHTYATGPTNVAVMAVLAREVGLMLYNDYIDPTNANLPVPSLCSFTTLSWGTVDATLFAIQRLEDEYSLTLRPYVRAAKIRLDQNSTSPNTKADSDAFRLVFTGNAAGTPVATMPEWADAAAYTKPSNDFAETFRLAAEAYVNPTTGIQNVTSIKIPFPNATNNTPVDLIANQAIASSVLASKMACIQNNQTVWANP